MVHPWTVRLEIESDTHVGGVPHIFSSAEEELKYYFCELKIDGVFSENVALAEIVAAEGCDGYLGSSEKVSNPKVGGVICVDEERSVWFLGLSFLALGIFTGSVLTCIVTSALTKRGYCGSSINIHTRVEQELTELDTTLEMEEEEDQII